MKQNIINNNVLANWRREYICLLNRAILTEPNRDLYMNEIYEFITLFNKDLAMQKDILTKYIVYKKFTLISSNCIAYITKK